MFNFIVVHTSLCAARYDFIVKQYVACVCSKWCVCFVQLNNQRRSLQPEECRSDSPNSVPYYPSLTLLDLSNNELSAVSRNICDLSQLAELKISNNFIREVMGFVKLFQTIQFFEAAKSWTSSVACINVSFELYFSWTTCRFTIVVKRDILPGHNLVMNNWICKQCLEKLSWTWAVYVVNFGADWADSCMFLRIYAPISCSVLGGWWSNQK